MSPRGDLIDDDEAPPDVDSVDVVDVIDDSCCCCCCDDDDADRGDLIVGGDRMPVEVDANEPDDDELPRRSVGGDTERDGDCARVGVLLFQFVVCVLCLCCVLL